MLAWRPACCASPSDPWGEVTLIQNAYKETLLAVVALVAHAPTVVLHSCEITPKTGAGDGAVRQACAL